MFKKLFGLAPALVLFIAFDAHALPSLVTGGQTSVLLDEEVLALAGLSIDGVGGDTIVPGTLPGSVAFPINPRTGGPGLNTTFEYDSATFPGAGSFAGTIEHSGSVIFVGPITVGDFTIGFDPARVSGTASGFFVQDNIDLGAILFDIGVTGATVTPSALEVAGNLLLSPEFASILGGDGAFVGVDAGDALVEAVAVAEPMSLALLSLGLVGLLGAMRPGRTARHL